MKIEEEYPEHMKLKAINHFTQKVAEFIDWLSEEKDIEMTDSDGRYFNKRALISEFFEVDMDRLEDEKVAMLESIRESNE